MGTVEISAYIYTKCGVKASNSSGLTYPQDISLSYHNVDIYERTDTGKQWFQGLPSATKHLTTARPPPQLARLVAGESY